jgi:hypothetical protein
MKILLFFILQLNKIPTLLSFLAVSIWLCIFKILFNLHLNTLSWKKNSYLFYDWLD